MKWVIDEMLPPTIASELRALGHDAVSVYDVGLAETADAVIFEAAVAEGRVVVTENFADFAVLLKQASSSERPTAPVVFGRKNDFRRGGGLARHVAEHLHRWSEANPDPYLGPHWP